MNGVQYIGINASHYKIIASLGKIGFLDSGKEKYENTCYTSLAVAGGSAVIRLAGREEWTIESQSEWSLRNVEWSGDGEGGISLKGLKLKRIIY